MDFRKPRVILAMRLILTMLCQSAELAEVNLTFVATGLTSPIALADFGNECSGNIGGIDQDY
jgi:hypothetical protein